jgi:uncharacterized protein (DUF2267 family)
MKISIYQETSHAMLGKEAPYIVQVLWPLLDIANDSTICVVLETLRSVLSIKEGNWLESNLVSTLTTAFLAVWQKNLRGQCR